jgi:hypothetical protein
MKLILENWNKFLSEEEESYSHVDDDLPFTNNDIRLLLLKYVDRLVKLESESDTDKIASLTDRVINYLENIEIKFKDGTAAFSAYETEINPDLSMFYYRTKDIGREFKNYILRRLNPNAPDVIYNQKEADRIIRFILGVAGIDRNAGGGQLQQMSFSQARAKAVEALREVSSYRFMRAAKSYSYFEQFISTQESRHYHEMLKRINNSFDSVKNLRDQIQRLELGDDFSNDKLIDKLEDIRDSYSSSTTREQDLFDITADFEKVENYIVDNNYKSAERTLRKIRRSMLNVLKNWSKYRGFYNRDKPDGIKYLENEILQFSQILKSQRDQLPLSLKQRIRDVRKSVEGFQTLFEQ